MPTTSHKFTPFSYGSQVGQKYTTEGKKGRGKGEKSEIFWMRKCRRKKTRRRHWRKRNNKMNRIH
jgi:hypothetical protein